MNIDFNNILNSLLESDMEEINNMPEPSAFQTEK